MRFSLSLSLICRSYDLVGWLVVITQREGRAQRRSPQCSRQVMMTLELSQHLIALQSQHLITAHRFKDTMSSRVIV
jgi:hypothetical protein